MKKKVLLIATWWTFASVETEDGLKPWFRIEELLDLFPESKEIADIECIQLCNLDSTNLHPTYWTKIANLVYDNYDKYDGFIVSHGTDTMQYSSSALSFALKWILKPVVLTGSVFSIEETWSDARMNFIDSVRVASSNLVKEVCVCFHNCIIKWTRARKVTNEATKITNEKIWVYSSINLHLIWNIDLWKIIGNKIYFTKNWYPKDSKLECLSEFDLNIGYIKIYPWVDSSILDDNKNKKAVIIEAFWPWNIPFEYSNWLGKIKELTTSGTMIFVATQNPFGEVDMDKYEVGQKAKKAGAISCYDMIPETAIVKLMWIFGNFPEYDSKQVKDLFLTNISGEITNI